MITIKCHPTGTFNTRFTGWTIDTIAKLINIGSKTAIHFIIEEKTIQAVCDVISDAWNDINES